MPIAFPSMEEIKMRISNTFKALSQFPPKLSELLTPLEDIESKIESTISTATGVSLPPGPVKVTRGLVENIEASLSSVMPRRALPISFKSQTAPTTPVKVEVVASPQSLGEPQAVEVPSSTRALRQEFEGIEA